MTIANTNATNKARITVDFPDSGSGNVKARLQSKIAISGEEIFQGSDVVTGQVYQCTLNAAGNVDATTHPSGWFLPVPDGVGTAAWVYRFTVTDSAGNERFLDRVGVSYSASPQSLAAILAAAASEVTADAVAGLISGKQNKDNDAVDGNLAIFADGETVDSGVDVSDLGGTPTAGSVSFDPAGDIEAVNVQDAIEELDTEKSGTGHNHTGTYDPAGTAATAVSAHSDDTTAVHGIADTSALLDADDIGDSVAAEGHTHVANEYIIIPCSDEATALTAGTAKATFRMLYAMTLTDVRASVNVAPTDSTLIVDINEGGSSILSTKLSIDATEKTSTTADVPAVISDSALADNAEIVIDITQVGSTVAGAGLKVALIGTRI
jgi:hypothetical protein